MTKFEKFTKQYKEQTNQDAMDKITVIFSVLHKKWEAEREKSLPSWEPYNVFLCSKITSILPFKSIPISNRLPGNFSLIVKPKFNESGKKSIASYYLKFEFNKEFETTSLKFLKMTKNGIGVVAS